MNSLSFASGNAGGLSDACVNALAKASIFGNGWIDQKEINREVLKTGKEISFYHHYTCGNCGRENSMKPNTQEKHTVCRGCGKPHSGENSYRKMINGELVVHESDLLKEEKELESVKKLRWKCQNCGNMIPGTKHACPGCGGNKEKGSEVSLPADRPTEIKQEFGKSEIPNVPFIEQQRLREYFNPTPQERITSREHELEKPWWKKSSTWMGAAVGAVPIGFFINWLFSTKDYDGTVSQMQWQYSIEIQEFSPVVKEGWCNDLQNVPHVMPVNGRGESPGVSQIQRIDSRIHHYNKVFSHIRYYTVDVPYQESYQDVKTVSNGNGSSTTRSVTRYRTKYRQERRQEDVYRDVPEYADWCSYHTCHWKTDRMAVSSGRNPQSEAELKTPEYQLERLERSMPMVSEYKVDFSYDQKGEKQSYSEEPKSAQEFMRWREGKDVIVVKRNLGSIAEVKEKK